MEKSSAVSNCHCILLPAHPKGGTGRIGMEHGPTVLYCCYILAPHYIREEPVSSLTIQLKSPTSPKSHPSPTSGICGEATPECEGQQGIHITALVLSS